ncbi:HIRAN domain-containing protein [Sphingomonas sp. DG1-23]|uniref:HIRAN domain-containing protein n=1 Tax=Sphingomonas sp. DG1-23 TaxID=3068316 RepID=UPI00273DC2B6|nr:HIRAN domain-containing protein [Sphingomonas sp. DG1-23]MDP5279927.1 HIRAN domain-containing protein [Sphingomonas sp. DG1-23]
MPLPDQSLAVVGADYPNKQGPGRRFELNICRPGEPIELRPEPKNPKDENAVAVYSARGVQLGYLTAERAPWIGGMLKQGREVRAIFQRQTGFGAWIRIAFDGEAPVLPQPKTENWESDFCVDPDPGIWGA